MIKDMSINMVAKDTSTDTRTMAMGVTMMNLATTTQIQIIRINKTAAITMATNTDIKMIITTKNITMINTMIKEPRLQASNPNMVKADTGSYCYSNLEV